MRPTRLRYLITIVIVLGAFAAIFFRMYNMQIANVDTYHEYANERTTRTLTLYGMRGTIYDKNMVPLAYDKPSYNVQFYRDPSLTTDAHREMYTKSIIEIIRLVEGAGKKTITEFWLEYGPSERYPDAVGWHFNTGTDNAAADAKRQQQWRANFSLNTTAVEDLFDALCRNYFIPEELPREEKLKILAIWQESRMNAFKPEPVTIAYGIDFETVEQIEVRSADMPGVSISPGAERVYPKKSVAAHTIGYISKISGEETMARYKEKGYPNDAIVGMTGIEYSMEDQLSPYIEYRQGKRVVELNIKGKRIRDLEYQAPVDGNDVVLTLDTQLQTVAEKALKRNIANIEKDQIEVMKTPRWKEMNKTELRRYGRLMQPVKTAQSGACVAINPNNGAVLAMANYPSYDLSIFGTGTVDPDAWREIVMDERNPMYNRAISARDTPGSIFKLVTALGGLMEGAITPDERISDKGEFLGTDTVHPPKCWIDSSMRYKHQDQTIVEGIKNSCNYFFYTVGQRLGSEKITNWAAKLGLTSRTGIELPNESTSFVGNQLMLYDSTRAIDDQYTSKPIFSAAMIKRMFRRVGADRGIEYDEERIDKVTKKLLDLVEMEGPKDEWVPKIRTILLEDMNIPSTYISRHTLVNEVFYCLSDLRWTNNDTIMSAIGQSITQVTPVAVARYVAAVANGGTVFDLHVIDKIVSPTGEVVLQKEPKIINQIYGADEYLSLIRRGMEEVTQIENDGTAAAAFAKAKYPIAAKTGTAQRSKVDIENNSWLVTYAPLINPEIVVVVYIQNGYAGARSNTTAINVIEHYLDSKKRSDSVTIPLVNRLAD